jgi:hypothetical protein
MKNGSWLNLIIIVLVTILIAANFALASGIAITDGLKIDGQIRERTEVDGRIYGFDSAFSEESYLRTRIGLEISKIENTVIYFQIQDSRFFASDWYRDYPNNDGVTGVRQAFIMFRLPSNTDFWFQLGRFEIEYGRGRLISAYDWDQQGRVFDGLRFGYDNGNFATDALILKLRENNWHDYDRFIDEYFYGIYTQIFNKNLHLFALLDHSYFTANDGKPSWHHWTLGGYYRLITSFGLDLQADFAYQNGIYGGTNTPDLESYMIAGEIGYTFHLKSTPRVAVGLDITSGEDGFGNTRNMFVNYFFDPHSIWGYMDYITGSTLDGIADFTIKTSFSPSKTTWIGADYHIIGETEAYGHHQDGLFEFGYKYGEEIDLTGKYEIYENLKAQLGISFFFPTEHFFIPTTDKTFWSYFMITAEF